MKNAIDLKRVDVSPASKVKLQKEYTPCNEGTKWSVKTRAGIGSVSLWDLAKCETTSEFASAQACQALYQLRSKLVATK